MFDYTETMRQASIIQGQADFLRTQSYNTAGLASIVGGSYEGEDAEAFQTVIDGASSDLLSLVNKLDDLASAIASAAKTQQQKLDLLEGEYTEFTYQ